MRQRWQTAANVCLNIKVIKYKVKKLIPKLLYLLYSKNSHIHNSTKPYKINDALIRITGLGFIKIINLFIIQKKVRVI